MAGGLSSAVYSTNAVSKFLNPGMNYKAYEIKRIEKDDAYTASRVGVYIPVVEEAKGHNAIRY